MANWRQNPDGTRTFFVDQDRIQAASLLDYEGAPELTEEQFEELVEEMRKAREAEDARSDEESSG